MPGTVVENIICLNPFNLTSILWAKCYKSTFYTLVNWSMKVSNMYKSRKLVSGKTGTYPLECDFRSLRLTLQSVTSVWLMEEKVKKGVTPKGFAPEPHSPSGHSQPGAQLLLPKVGWCSHGGMSTPRHMQRLSDGYVGAVSFKGTYFHSSPSICTFLKWIFLRI